MIINNLSLVSGCGLLSVAYRDGFGTMLPVDDLPPVDFNNLYPLGTLNMYIT